MLYKIIAKKSRYGEVTDWIKTEDGDSIYIVTRGDQFKLRRCRSTKNTFVWDLSRDAYDTLDKAKAALLSGDVEFIGG